MRTDVQRRRLHQNRGLRQDLRGASLQDLLIYGLKGLSLVAVEARKHKLDLTEINRFTLQATFSTLTNVDFDPARFVELIGRCAALREDLKKR